jgi:hypothetical protein
MPPARDDEEELRIRISVMLSCALLVNTVVAAATLLLTQETERIPYHDSALSGIAWVQELLNGHPERIKTELGMHKHVFLSLVTALRIAGFSDSRRITLIEQVAIFLYMSVTGLRIRHVAERFQRSNETISR